MARSVARAGLVVERKVASSNRGRSDIRCPVTAVVRSQTVVIPPEEQVAGYTSAHIHSGPKEVVVG